MVINHQKIKTISILSIILAVIIGIIYGFYTSVIGGKADVKSSIDGKYFLINQKNELLEINKSLWYQAITLQYIYHVFFILNIIAILYLVYNYLFLNDLID